LVHFVFLWYVFPLFWYHAQEKSGNPDCHSPVLDAVDGANFFVSPPKSGLAVDVEDRQVRREGLVVAQERPGEDVINQFGQ
jgi:hypothetical protein